MIDTVIGGDNVPHVYDSKQRKTSTSLSENKVRNTWITCILLTISTCTDIQSATYAQWTTYMELYRRSAKKSWHNNKSMNKLLLIWCCSRAPVLAPYLISHTTQITNSNTKILSLHGRFGHNNRTSSPNAQCAVKPAQRFKKLSLARAK